MSDPVTIVKLKEGVLDFIAFCLLVTYKLLALQNCRYRGVLYQTTDSWVLRRKIFNYFKKNA